MMNKFSNDSEWLVRDSRLVINKEKMLNSILDTLSYFGNIKHLDSRKKQRISRFDLILIRCLLYQYSVERAVEIGAGETSRVITNEGVKLISFTKQLMSVGGEWKNNHLFSLKQHDLYSGLDVLKRALVGAQLLFIDGHHCYQFANVYCKLFDDFDGLVLIHDCYTSPHKITGEQERVEAFMDKVVWLSDIEHLLGAGEKDEISSLIGFDLSEEAYATKYSGQNASAGWVPSCLMCLNFSDD